eukprot:TRINITY_DN5088_c0_g2_i1.p1 TRINITY_DN5088_c0_g2~~TRINITY_DN5088_c0_g2_i1.p1  ORF type:complete len:402 (+),score=100.11 TRINITY_DN5088_c0_g2_i1:137-1207(+)
MDLYGGTSSECALKLKRKFGDFTYTWEQEAFDPVTRMTQISLHFRMTRTNKVLRRAFSYRWRLWTIPEAVECLEEAGFQKVVVWMRGMPDLMKRGGRREEDEEDDEEEEEEDAVINGKAPANAARLAAPSRNEKLPDKKIQQKPAPSAKALSPDTEGESGNDSESDEVPVASGKATDIETSRGIAEAQGPKTAEKGSKPLAPPHQPSTSDVTGLKKGPTSVIAQSGSVPKKPRVESAVPQIVEQAAAPTENSKSESLKGSKKEKPSKIVASTEEGSKEGKKRKSAEGEKVTGEKKRKPKVVKEKVEKKKKEDGLIPSVLDPIGEVGTEAGSGLSGAPSVGAKKAPRKKEGKEKFGN